MTSPPEATDSSVSARGEPRRGGRLVLGVVLVAAGAGLATLASRMARGVEVPPFGCGLLVWGLPERTDEAQEGEPGPEGEVPAGNPADSPPPAADAVTEGESPPSEGQVAPPSDPQAPPRSPPSDTGTDGPAEGATPVTGAAEPAEPPGPVDLGPWLRPLTPEDRAAIREAFEPLGIGATLAVRAVKGAEYVPPGGWLPVRPVYLAVVTDEEADRVLVPLAGDADVYLAAEDYLTAALTPEGAEAAADLRTATLPASARLLRSHVLVRPRAAEALGLSTEGPAPNCLAVTLVRPGALEEAGPAALSLGRDRRVRPVPVDLAVRADRPERWLGVAGLALEVAGLAILGLAAVRRLGRAEPPSTIVLRHVVEGAEGLAGQRAFGPVLTAMAAALAVGAVWAPPTLVEVLQTLTHDPRLLSLSSIGLSGLRPEAGALVSVFLNTALVDTLWNGVVAIGVAALVPGLGLVTATAGRLLEGTALAPVTLTLLDRVPLRAAVAGVKVHAFAALAVGAWRVLLGTVRPSALGQENRRMGFAAGAAELYGSLPLAMAILLAGALLETLLVALVGWL